MDADRLMDLNAIRKYLALLSYEGIEKMSEREIIFLVTEDRVPFLVWLLSKVGAKLRNNPDVIGFLKEVLTGYGFCKCEEVDEFFDDTLDELQQLKIYHRIFNAAATMTRYPIRKKVQRMPIRDIQKMLNYRKDVHSKPNKYGKRVNIVKKYKVDISAMSTELEQLSAELGSLPQKSTEPTWSKDKSEACFSKEVIESLKTKLANFRETIAKFRNLVGPTWECDEICGKELSEAMIHLRDPTSNVDEMLTSGDTITTETLSDPIQLFPIPPQSEDVDELIKQLQVNWLEDEDFEEHEDTGLLLLRVKSNYVETECSEDLEEEEDETATESESRNIKIDRAFNRTLELNYAETERTEDLEEDESVKKSESRNIKIHKAFNSTPQLNYAETERTEDLEEDDSFIKAFTFVLKKANSRDIGINTLTKEELDFMWANKDDKSTVQSFSGTIKKANSSDVGVNTLTDEELRLMWASMNDTSKDNDVDNTNTSTGEKGKGEPAKGEEAVCVDGESNNSKFLIFPNEESIFDTEMLEDEDIEFYFSDVD